MILLTSALRFLMLAALLAGMLAKPALAVACAIHDVQPAASDVRPGETDESDEGCCQLSDCGDCCAQAVALRQHLTSAPAIVVAAPDLPVSSIDIAPIVIGVALRPPIGA